MKYSHLLKFVLCALAVAQSSFAAGPEYEYQCRIVGDIAHLNEHNDMLACLFTDFTLRVSGASAAITDIRSTSTGSCDFVTRANDDNAQLGAKLDPNYHPKKYLNFARFGVNRTENTREFGWVPQQILLEKTLLSGANVGYLILAESGADGGTTQRYICR